MSFLTSFLLNHAVELAVGTVVGAPMVWVAARYVYEKLNPIEQMVECSEREFNRVGLKMRRGIDRRVKDRKLREKMRSDIEDGSERLQDAFVLGLQGKRMDK